MTSPAFGPWIVERPIGRGAHATVYRCHHRDDPAVIAAVKVLHGGDAAAPRLVARLAREARILQRLDHPGIVRILGADVAAEEPWIAIELVDGAPLDRARPGRRPPGEVLALARNVADALAHAHGVGVFHRDVKPGNLLVDRATGRVRVVDFGVSAARGENTLTDPAGPAPGTVDYAPPEWFRTPPNLLDPVRVDAYGLGVVLYEQLTGERPFRGHLPRVMAAKAAPLDPTDAPEVLRTTVRALTEPEPRRRASPAEVLAALSVPSQAPARAPVATVVAPGDAFVDRPADRAALDALPEEARLVTLVGPPGVGKSRLAREWCRRRGPTPWVELGEATDLAGALRAAGRTLSCAPTLAAVTGELRGGRWSTVLLDDADAVLDALREVLPQAFRETPAVRFVVTARRRLRIGGERVWTVAPLAVPVEDEPSPAGELLRLRIAERGGRAPDDATVAELVRAVDGLPLAIELAAGSLAVADGEDGLRAVLDAAWAQLDDEQRRVLAGCSVFRAPFGLRAAEDVVGTGDRPMSEVLQGLVERSWLSVRRGRGAFTWLRTLREFAHRQLAGEDAAEIRSRHAFAAARPADQEARPTPEEVDEALGAWDTAEAIGDPDLAVTLAVVVASGAGRPRGPWVERARALLSGGHGAPADRERLAALLG